jgi:hypothetical protein
MSESHGVAVREGYRDYVPPVDVRRAVGRLLRGVPKNRLSGLNAVVLSNSGNLNKKVRKANIRQSGRSFKAGTARGQYHAATKSESAWIEMWVDNILAGWPRPVLWFAFTRDAALSGTLYHELGHHIHHTQAPRHLDRETVAETWKARLRKTYFRSHYWYLRPLLFVLWLVLKPVSEIMKRREKANKSVENVAP